MGFFKNLADKGQAVKLYAELREVQTVLGCLTPSGKELIYEQLIDYLSEWVEQSQDLPENQQVLIGIKMTQGCVMRLRTEPFDVIPRWIFGAFLISGNIAASDKQSEVFAWTKQIINTGAKIVRGVELNL